MGMLLTSGGMLVSPVVQPARIQLRVYVGAVRLVFSEFLEVGGSVSANTEVYGGEELGGVDGATVVAARTVSCKVDGFIA